MLLVLMTLFDRLPEFILVTFEILLIKRWRPIDNHALISGNVGGPALGCVLTVHLRSKLQHKADIVRIEDLVLYCTASHLRQLGLLRFLFSLSTRLF